MKPSRCPFCGNPDCFACDTRRGPKGYHVHCDVCKAYGPIAQTPAVARSLWDERFKPAEKKG